MIDHENEDRSIETSEDEAKPPVNMPPALQFAVRLQRAEMALRLAGFSISTTGEWLPPTSGPSPTGVWPKSEILTNEDVIELTGGLRQGAAQIGWIKQYLKIDAPRKADGHPLLTWRQLGRSDDVPSTRSKINWTKP